MVELVASWITGHCHLSSNIGVGISEGCFITSVGRSAHLAYHVHKNGRETSIINHQSLSHLKLPITKSMNE